MRARRDVVIDAILALNGEEVPFSFSRTPTGAVGIWDYADAKWAGILAAGSVDRTFEMHVVLNDDGTYSMSDRSTSMTTSLSMNGGSFERTSFRGRIYKRSWSSNAAPIASDHGRVGHTFGWQFDSEEMRRPVAAVLEQHGWSKRKGFWARLFGV